MRSGATVDQFWSMTPRETYQFIRAAIWRTDQNQKVVLWQAWHTAAFMRAKRLPSYSEMAKPKQTRRLSDDEKSKKHAEFEDLKKRIEHG